MPAIRFRPTFLAAATASILSLKDDQSRIVSKVAKEQCKLKNTIEKCRDKVELYKVISFLI
jgi:hypothetical protein